MDKIKIDSKNLVELLNEIHAMIPEMDDIGIISVSVYNNKAQNFWSITSTDDRETNTYVQYGNMVGEFVRNDNTRRIVAPEKFSYKNFDIIPTQILETYEKATNTPKVIVRYIFSLLHEIGHLYASVDHLGYNARTMSKIMELSEAFNDELEDRLGKRMTKKEADARYRNSYAELFADHFAYKHLLTILINVDVSKYFTEVK